VFRIPTPIQPTNAGQYAIRSTYVYIHICILILYIPTYISRYLLSVTLRLYRISGNKSTPAPGPDGGVWRSYVVWHGSHFYFNEYLPSLPQLAAQTQTRKQSAKLTAYPQLSSNALISKKAPGNPNASFLNGGVS